MLTDKIKELVISEDEIVIFHDYDTIITVENSCGDSTIRKYWRDYDGWYKNIIGLTKNELFKCWMAAKE